MNLPPSKLGTQEYWDEFYKTEIKNFEENPEDTGECWFDDSGAEDRMVTYIDDELNLNGHVGKLLDLGTGNGHLLFALREAGIQGEFLGIDYSPASVAFATKVAASNDELSDIKFKHVDFMSNPQWTTESFDLVLDKGTLDAIALSTIQNATEKYISSVVPIIKKGGKFMITSCNFTKAELVEIIKMELVDEITYPSFTFGGQRGSSVVTLIFEKQQ